MADKRQWRCADHGTVLEATTAADGAVHRAIRWPAAQRGGRRWGALCALTTRWPVAEGALPALDSLGRPLARPCHVVEVS